MKVNVINADAPSLHESFGISDERATEICKAMDAYTNQQKKNKNMAVGMSDVAEFCQTVEELIFAIVTHTLWLEKRRMIQYAEPLAYTKE